MTPHALIRGLLLLMVVPGAVSPLAAQRAQPPAPTRVILFIGDGVGTAYWTAALFAADRLAVQGFPVVGLVDTRAADSKVTDSAASATAYAAGVRTFNGAIGMGADSAVVTSVLELARDRGLATGLVATSRITHATPAAFAAHVLDRNLEHEIARDIVEQNVTVVLGGGRTQFDPRWRPDTLDLLAAIRSRYAYVETGEDLRRLDPDTVQALFGLFAEHHLPPAGPRLALHAPSHPTAVEGTGQPPARDPTLAEMTRVALAVLDHDPDGFFLMVEGSQPDWRGHENAPLSQVIAEVLDFDQAIAVGLEYRERRPETLLVVVADHETGGLALEVDTAGAVVGRYTTSGHTATLVPLFAIGPGAERFAGIQPNYRIGLHLIDVVARERKGR